MSLAASNPVNFEQLASGRPALRRENITFAGGAGSGASNVLLAAGVALVVVAALLGWQKVGGVWSRQALSAYHVGVMAVLAMCLGATFFTMVFHLTNAGWTATIRRQFENIMSFLPFAWAMLLPTLLVEIAVGGRMFQWIADAGTDVVLAKKGGYFYWPLHAEAGAFPAFFVLRTLAYGAFWTYLSTRLRGYSLRQDREGGSELSARARFTCAWAMPVFALSIAFCAFDYLMTVDYKFFSTMWGVYYFAGGAFACPALVTLILVILLGRGRLKGAVTPEHFHDLGKLMFSFTVFWAYIAFSQYFLIWYSNIPEETAFYLHRKHGGWQYLGIFLMVGHFGLPFLYLVSRVVKKHAGLMTLATLWFLLVHVLDIYWIVRPMTYANPGNAAVPGMGPVVLVDVLAIVGVLAIFAGFLVRRVASGVLVAVGDPHLDEALEHRNWI